MSDKETRKRNDGIRLPSWTIVLFIGILLSMVGALWGMVSADVSDLKDRLQIGEINQAQTREKLDLIEELLREVRQDIKEMRKSK